MDNDLLKNRELQKEKSQLRSYKVVKSNILIQKSRFNLSVQEQKIILYIISKLKPSDESVKLYEFKISEFCKVCGIDHKNGKNYKDLKENIKNLSDKSIWIKLDNGKETLLRWIQKPYINDNDGTIEIKLDDDMKPYLLELQGKFTNYELLYTLAMKSQYSIRIYELLKSYEWKHNLKIDIDELKKMLFAENYKRFPDFKRYVLDIAIREINEFSDLNIKYDVEKVGRRYAKILFQIKLKKDIESRLLTWKNIDERIDPNELSLYDKINNRGKEVEKP